LVSGRLGFRVLVYKVSGVRFQVSAIRFKGSTFKGSEVKKQKALVRCDIEGQNS
jgi:hypothetical protein